MISKKELEIFEKINLYERHSNISVISIDLKIN